MSRTVRPPGIIPACAGSTYRTPRCMAPCRDHPRMRGEHTHSHRFSFRLPGSSPHARGALEPLLDVQARAGIIPACAGSTRSRPRCMGRRWDHPRMRGEHVRRRRMISRKEGSSPHARGAPGGDERAEARPGIIPACAGSTRVKLVQHGQERDHPRMRGEHVSNSAMHGPV